MRLRASKQKKVDGNLAADSGRVVTRAVAPPGQESQNASKCSICLYSKNSYQTLTCPCFGLLFACWLGPCNVDTVDTQPMDVTSLPIPEVSPLKVQQVEDPDTLRAKFQVPKVPKSVPASGDADVADLLALADHAEKVLQCPK